DRYDGEKLGKELIAKIALLQNNLTQHRQQNFIGAMLKHHTMKSTQYMSKWIEAKNKLEND
ncbi:MAG: glycosyltransferase, partial [Gammaproteobacteria bacterium]|nr:glycosyltransferase [Gammaproteobacteria bacterium]